MIVSIGWIVTQATTVVLAALGAFVLGVRPGSAPAVAFAVCAISTGAGVGGAAHG